MKPQHAADDLLYMRLREAWTLRWSENCPLGAPLQCPQSMNWDAPMGPRSEDDGLDHFSHLPWVFAASVHPTILNQALAHGAKISDMRHDLQTIAQWVLHEGLMIIRNRNSRPDKNTHFSLPVWLDTLVCIHEHAPHLFAEGTPDAHGSRQLSGLHKVMWSVDDEVGAQIMRFLINKGFPVCTDLINDAPYLERTHPHIYALVQAQVLAKECSSATHACRPRAKI